MPRSRRARQRADQASVVALVQADARLVEDVEHAHQARADLRRQADALRLAAGERVGGAVDRQVVEADIDEEAEPRLDLFEDLTRDDALAVGQRQDVGDDPVTAVAQHQPRSGPTADLPFLPFAADLAGPVCPSELLPFANALSHVLSSRVEASK